MKKPIKEQRSVLKSLLSGEITIHKAADLLECSRRSIERYRTTFLSSGIEGLIDHRHSNFHKLSESDQQHIIRFKENDRWRSARNIRDTLHLPVSEQHVLRILRKVGLTRENLKRVKPIQRFEAKVPNELWQCDIMGKIVFPNLGPLYLIATLDDHSRFVLSGRWFHTQGKMHVFRIWYEALSRWGLPKAMLQDEGSQYKARVRFGTADYEWYAKQIGVELLWAPKPQVKGKIERFWKFVQKDFVPGILRARTIDEVNGAWRVWLAWYNYKFKSSYFDNEPHAARYKSSERRLKRVELETLLLIEERRKVTRESTISLYGKHYYVPPGYIGCHIWVKIKGDTLFMEANGKIFHRARLRL